LGQAEATGAVVEAVTAWNIPTSYGFGPTVLEGEDLAAVARQTLAAAVDDASAAYPNIVVHQLVQRGHPAQCLSSKPKARTCWLWAATAAADS
jgi:hypothetical protein